MNFMSLDLARTLVDERVAEAELRRTFATARKASQRTAGRVRTAPRHRRLRRLATTG
jgi:hypothetical protein